MKRTVVLCAAISLCAAAFAWADYGVIDRGTWPENWPKELELLRAQARTLDGPLAPQLHFAIHFQNREQFEAAWPQLLKLKGADAPLVLKRGPDFFLGEEHAAGVVVHSPLPRDAKQLEKPASTAAKDAGADGGADFNYTLVLVVDGDIVDLNRIPLPADTLIVDERFKEKP